MRTLKKYFLTQIYANLTQINADLSSEKHTATIRVTCLPARQASARISRSRKVF